MTTIDNHPHEDLTFAKLQGFYDFLMDGPDLGRTHVTNQDWNNAYDEGRTEAEALNGPEDSKPFSLPEIPMFFDEKEYQQIKELVTQAAQLAGDGGGGDLGINAEYERGMAELIMRTCGLSADLVDDLVRAIHAVAKELNEA